MDSRLYDGAADCLALVAAWAQASREAGLETSLRISLRTGDERFDRYGTTVFQDQACGLPVDIVDVSSGFYNIDKRLIYPTSLAAVLQERRRETAALASRHPATQFILSGRASAAVEDFPGNVHLGLCRENRRARIVWEFGARGSLLPKPFGVTCAPITHEPLVNGVEDFGLVRQEKPDAPELARCWRQQEPAHKLINLKNIPTLQMSAQFGLAEVSKEPAVAFHRNLIFEDLQRLP